MVESTGQWPFTTEELKQRPVDDFLKMERREVTILFADLRGFIALAGIIYQ